MPVGEPDAFGVPEPALGQRAKTSEEVAAEAARPPRKPSPQFRGYDTPDGRPPLSKRRRRILFFIGLFGGSGFSLFILSLAPDVLKTLLQMIFLLVGCKLVIGLLFIFKWRTRTLGNGLLLSIPLTIVLLIGYVIVRAVLASLTAAH